ncbi:MAG: ABC transporter permease [Myxococcaceae bacterium]
MIHSFLAVAFNSFREARRNRVSVVVVAFAVALLFSTTLVANVTVITFGRVITDFGLGAMSISLVVLTIFLSCSQLSREIERKTIFLIVSKPVSRGEFLVARFVGNMFTLGVLICVMSLIFALEVILNGVALTGPQLTAIVMLFFELLVVASIGFLLSSFSSQLVSAVVTTGVYLAGHLSEDMYALASRAKAPLMKPVGHALYYVLPNLGRLNYRPNASYNLPSSLSALLGSAAYGTAYAALMITIAVIIFSRRDFR